MSAASGQADFDFLTGIVRVDAPAPPAWREQGLTPFFTDPNHEAWGGTLCRRLYHETLHFWQVMGWGFVANAVAADWLRLLQFEASGQVPPPTRHGMAALDEAGAAPFSPRDLLEAAARFWDVHTRSPARVVADEGLQEQAQAYAGGPLERPAADGPGLRAYTNHAFDFVMQHGPDCQRYARPYRWLLDRVEGASAFAVLIFPLCVHAAMGTPDPVRVFCAAVHAAWQHPVIRSLVGQRSGSIHADWLMLWPPMQRLVLGPACLQAGVMAYTPGLDVIARGPLAQHPVYRDCLARAHFQGWLKLMRPPAEAGVVGEALWQAACEQPLILFALPGEPYYRRALADNLPPPLACFANMQVAAARPVAGKLLAAQQGRPWHDDFAPACTELDARVQRLRAAEYAVSLGLPPDAFSAGGPSP